MHIQTLAFILAIGILVSGLLILSRMRLQSLVNVFQAQSVMLALLALLSGIMKSHAELYAIALLIFAVKGVVIPLFLLKIRRSVHASERLLSYVRPTPMTFAGIGVIILAAFAAGRISPAGESYFFALTATSLVFFGITLLLTRRDMYGQAMGFLVLENGLYAFGLTITHSLPFFVEIGILFDVLVVFVLFFALIRRAHVEHASTATEHLSELTD